MHRLSLWFVGLFLIAQPVAAQPPTVPAQKAPNAAPPQARNPFNLSPGEQAWLDQVLNKWEKDSATVKNFYCDFERDVHDQFGPGNGLPTKKEKGKLGYTRPDKGSFQITESLVWAAKPQAAPPGVNQPPQPPQGDWIKQEDEMVGDHWVCDGKSVYEFVPKDKELKVRPIPPQMQGQRIVDGPLPFLFGAEAKKLKERYWIRPAKELCNATLIGLHVKPKFQAAAAEYSDVWVVLRNEQQKPLMPAGLRILRPDRSWHEYRFQLADAQVNGRLAAILEPLFRSPRTPLGWTRINEPMPRPPAQAQRPAENPAK